MHLPNGDRLTPADDERLIQSATNGCDQAIGELLQSCRTYLLSVGEREIGANLIIKAAASDLVQETFIEGHKSIASFRGRTRLEFQMWLRGIFLHKLADVRRKFRTEARDLTKERRPPNHSSILALAAREAMHEETPSWEVMRQEEENHLRATLGRLPEEYRDVIQWRNFELLSFKEMSERHGRTEGAWRAIWGRAIKRLEKELRSDLGECE